MPVVYEPTACFVAQGRKRVMLGTTVFEYFPGTHIVASVSLPVIGQVIEASPAAPYLSVQLDLDLRELSELSVRYPAPREALSDGPAGLTLHQTPAALADAVMRLAGLLDTPEDIDALGPLVTREILYRLLVDPDVDVVRHMAQADSRLSQISRAIVWIRAHFAEPVRIEDAAAHAGMSRSTFHLHFKAITGMSPLEFRNHLRMQEARRLMTAHAMDAASAGFAVGYDSPSHFSRDYARFFGATPASDARRLRAAG